MGIFKPPQGQQTPAASKRKSLQADFSNLGPLKPGGTVGFMNFRDNAGAGRNGKGNKRNTDDEMDSDDDDDDDSILGRADHEEGKFEDAPMSADEIRRQSELSEGVRKIKVSSERCQKQHPKKKKKKKKRN